MSLELYTAEDDAKLSAIFELDPGQAKLGDGVIIDLDIEENQLAAINENTDIFMDIPSPTDKVKRLCARKLIVNHLSKNDVSKSTNFKIWDKTGMTVLSSNQGEAKFHDIKNLRFFDSISCSIVLDSLCSIFDDLMTPYRIRSLTQNDIRKMSPDDLRDLRFELDMDFCIKFSYDQDSNVSFLEPHDAIKLVSPGSMRIPVGKVTSIQ
jgi:hypothetical protein